jgi:hypothetical protein
VIGSSATTDAHLPLFDASAKVVVFLGETGG